MHKNHPYPPSLPDREKLRLGKKSDLLTVLTQKTQHEPPSTFDVEVLDGTAVVHFLPASSVTTFDEYVSSGFLPHIMKHLETSKRVDVVWDTYITSSIKESTREKRGKGIQRKVTGQTKLPGNWPDFLCDPKNKQELFTLISSIIASTAWPKAGFHYIWHQSGWHRQQSLHDAM